VILGHLHVSGVEPSPLSERRISTGEAIAGELFPGDAAYVALGHLHKPQRVGGREEVRYAGSPIPLAMNEAEYRHQVLVVDVGEVGGGRAERASTTVRPIEVPRTVELMRVPASARRDRAGGGSATLDEVLPLLAALPADDGRAQELRPYLEVHVRLDRPQPDLRARIEQALDGRLPRLVKITVERGGDGAALGDAERGVALADLAPRDVLVRRWAREHEGEPPPALLAAFDELVLRVQEGP
jgi:exonuclease SbcD